MHAIWCAIWNIPSGFATIIASVLALAAAGIAWSGIQRQIRSSREIAQQQIRSTQEIEAAKVRLDLYDRRFLIFVSIFDFFEALYQWEGTAEQKAAQKRFFRAYQESGFLFSSESGIEAALKHLHEESGKVVGFKEHGKEMMSGGTEFYLEQHAAMNKVLLVDFEDVLLKVKTESAKYLNFH